MIDIHTHILPSVDDGAKSLDEALEMLSIAMKGKTEAIILTPHCNFPKRYNNYDDEFFKQRFKLFKQKAAAYFPIDLFLGMEVYATDNVAALIKRGKIITLNRSRYLLIEFPFSCHPRWAAKILSSVSKLGITPIIAHPERYPFIWEQPNILYDWVNCGSLVQMNRSSLFGSFGQNAKDLALQLLSHHLVHFVASDCHSASVRTPFLPNAYNLISDLYSDEYAHTLLHGNPQKVIADKPIIPLKPTRILD